MHEMSLAEGILQIVEETAAHQGFKRVTEVRLEIGALSGVEIEALSFCLDVVLKGSVAEAIINTIREPFVVLDENLNVIFASRTFYQIFKSTRESAVGHPIYTLCDNQWDTLALRELFDNILVINKSFEGYEIYYDFPVIGKRLLTLNARQIIGKIGVPKMILLSIFIRWDNPIDILPALNGGVSRSFFDE